MQEHRITVLPSGHQFFALERETLLDAALRSGLNINFSCASGSCGDCRARLVEGVLGAEDFHDHHLSAAEKGRGMFLLCTSHAAGDLVIEAGEARTARDIPHQQIKARVHKIQAVSEHMRILQLRTPRTTPLRFLAGQHVALTLPGSGTLDSSVASCPCNGSQLQFHIPYRPGDPFTERLFAGLRHSTELEIDGPFGEMTLDDESPRPLLMVAQGHQFAPLKSLIEHAINLDLAQPVRLIWLAPAGGHYLANHCRSWGEALDDYRFVPLTSAEGEPDEAQAERALQAIREQTDSLAEWDIYYAGSAGFNQALGAGLAAAGANSGRLFAPHRRDSERLQGAVLSG